MNIESFLWLSLGIILLVALGISIKKRSFEPLTGEIYLIAFFGIHLFEVRLGDKTAKFFQKLPFYILFWPFNRISFIYEWVQEMTYSDYLKKKKKAEDMESEDYSVSLLWRPKLKTEDLDPDGSPKDKSTMVLVSRRERMFSLRSLESITIAVQFETKDTFRGYRLYTLFLTVESLRKITSKPRRWQEASTKKFGGEFMAWAKGVSYTEFQETTISKLSKELGRSQSESFIDEINEDIRTEFGYFIKSAESGHIYLNPESQDMLESQEKKKKAQDEKDAADINAQTVQVNADAEALRIKTVEKAVTEVIDERTRIAVQAFKELTGQQVQLLQAKYGQDGIGKLTGTYIEASGAESNGVDVKELIKDILAFKIAKKSEGGTA